MTIASSVVDEVTAHATECQPLECCGLLLGTSDHITQAVRSPNIADSPTRFLLDPRTHIEARTERPGTRDCRSSVSTTHTLTRSRIRRPPISRGRVPGCVHLIVGFVDGKAEVRLFNYPGRKRE